MILTVPTFLAVTLPVDLSTVAMAVSEVLKDFPPLFPVRLTVVVLPTGIVEVLAVAVIDWAALMMVNVFVIVPA